MNKNKADQTKKTSDFTSQKRDLSHGLQLEWCLGLNYELAEGVINLTNDQNNEVCYTSGHTIVIYDFIKNKQRLLQGHPNKISAICYNKMTNILVTADEGETSMLIVWNAETGFPIRTIFEPEKLGIISIDISNDGEKLLTLGKAHNGVQKIRIWKWKDTSNQKPIEIESEFEFSEQKYPNYNPFRYIKFNQYDLTEFVTTGKDEVRFFRIEKNSCSSYSPNSLMKKESMREQTHELSQTLFLPEEGSNVAVTGTEEGNLVVWDIILIMEEEGNLNHRREVKSINLFGKVGTKNPGVSLLTIHGKYLVVGTSIGTVRFYDFRFRIVCWFEDLNLSRITSISFSSTTKKRNKSSNQAEISEANNGKVRFDNSALQNTQNSKKNENSTKINEFNQTNFSQKMNETSPNLLTENDDSLDFPELVVCDVDARLTLLEKEIFHEIDVSKRQGVTILQSIDKRVLSISCSPNNRKLAIACSNSKVYEWILCTAKLTVLKSFKEDGHMNELPTCISYSPNGDYLVVGTSQGNIFIKNSDATTFSGTPLLISQKKKGISCELIRFSPDMKYFAISDDLKCVSIFKLGHKYDDPSQPIEWVFAAKIRVHTGKINDLCFSGNSEKLFSVSEDMYMAEYNVTKSKDTLFVEHLDKIESEDPPTACIYYSLEKNEEMILVANAGYKLKLWNVVNQQRVCRLTCLGPTFAGPISNMSLISECQEDLTKNTIDRSEFLNEKTDLNVQSKEKTNTKKSQNSKFYSEKEAKKTDENIFNFEKQSTKPEKNSENKLRKSQFNFDREESKNEFIKSKDDEKGNSSEKINNEQNDKTQKYLAFSTNEKVIGIIKLPLDRNPNNSIAIIAHSGKISCMEPTKNGKYLLTAGDSDLSLNVWKVNYELLRQSPLMNSSTENANDIFPTLLEGGAQGQLYRDLKDFFYYCQIRRKEENTTKAHKLDGKIPLKEIPNLMISLGYYPTIREIENMQNEIKYSKLHQNVLTEDLDLETFVKLFINHRPAYGLTSDYISDLVSTVFPKEQVSRKEFLNLILNYGEKLGNESLDYYFDTLMGIEKPGEQLPETFDVKFLVENIFGFEDQEKNEGQSVK